MSSVMAYITSTYKNPVCLCYRLEGKVNGRAHPVVEINLAARALNVPVAFPSELHFETFKKTIEDLINQKRILIGSTKGTQAEKINEDLSKEDNKNAKAQVDAKVDTLTEQTDGAVNVKVEKDDGTKKG